MPHQVAESQERRAAFGPQRPSRTSGPARPAGERRKADSIIGGRPTFYDEGVGVLVTGCAGWWRLDVNTIDADGCRA